MINKSEISMLEDELKSELGVRPYEYIDTGADSTVFKFETEEGRQRIAKIYHSLSKEQLERYIGATNQAGENLDLSDVFVFGNKEWKIQYVFNPIDSAVREVMLRAMSLSDQVLGVNLRDLLVDHALESPTCEIPTTDGGITIINSQLISEGVESVLGMTYLSAHMNMNLNQRIDEALGTFGVEIDTVNVVLQAEDLKNRKLRGVITDIGAYVSQVQYES